MSVSYPSSDFAPDVCSSEIPQYASILAGTAVVGCLQYEEDRLGWMTKDENVVPVMTLLPPAQDELFSVIICNCTTDCSTARCSCRKHSLECSPACGQCRGIRCSNSIAADISDEDGDDNDDDR